LTRIIVIGLVLCFCASCGEYDNLELQGRLDKRVDSLFHANKDSLRKLSDSLCNQQYELYYQTALDSIKVAQVEKIKSLIKEQ